MGKKTKPSIRIFSLLMACLLAISASVQFNDSDWYFWFPLYTCGCLVNFVGGIPATKSPNNIIKPLAKFTLSIGLFLFVKVVFEDLLRNKEVSGFWSVDMRERVVREKIGSGLVIGSMALQLINPKPAHHFEYGMAVLVGIGYGLSLYFYVYHMKEMKF